MCLIRRAPGIHFNKSRERAPNVGTRSHELPGIVAHTSRSLLESSDLSGSALVKDYGCGPGNVAAYGSCIASSYASLEVHGLPGPDAPAYPGLAFDIRVVKKDACNQTISNDFSSFVQAESLSILGKVESSLALARIQGGIAVMSVLLKPTFSLVSTIHSIAKLRSSPIIFVSGVDALSSTLVTMQSPIYSIFMASNTSVCPLGYVLQLEQSTTGLNKLGACVFCPATTYSVSPLSGYGEQPSCFNCPAGAASDGCAGGSKVKFASGVWVIWNGMFRLVGCPEGHQLLNSFDGVWTHDSQRCVACAAGEYILSPNNSRFTCQKCPVGAFCEGSVVRGLVEGSVWEANWTTGMYTLESCPAGYQVLNTNQGAQQCGQCPPAFYCTGGKALSIACPVGTFTPPGANTSSSCKPVYYVDRVVSLPLTTEQFSAQQTSFEQALAAAAGVAVGNVMVQSVAGSTSSRSLANDEQEFCFQLGKLKEDDMLMEWLLQSMTTEDLVVLRDAVEAALSLNSHARTATQGHKRKIRRTTTAAVQVITKIATPDSRAATALNDKLNSVTLNAQLVAHGLPEGTLDAVTVESLRSPPFDAASTTSYPLIIGVSLGGLLFLLVILVSGYFLWATLRIHSARMAFLAAYRKAVAGDDATANHLPYELQSLYQPRSVLGRGAFGCVILADSKQGQKLAIKIIVPQTGVFDEKESRQLSREANVLHLFTNRKCEHAARLAGVQAVHIQPEICWFVMEYFEGLNLETVISSHKLGPISDIECIRAARDVLAALKVIHSEGILHRDIKPANIMQCPARHHDQTWDGRTFNYKLLDFGTVLGVDENVAKEEMMTIASSRQMCAGTLPYMSPEMIIEPERAQYSTDLWSLGVSMFQVVTGCLSFEADGEMLLSLAVAGNMDVPSPSVLDKLSEELRSTFDNHLAQVIAGALEKRTADRFQSVDEMHDALYCCLINRDEAFYSVFISYRVASEGPFARLLFDELNHSVTPGGHRVTVYWDAHRLVKGEDWETSFATGLLNSLCFFPLLSYGATAPLAELPGSERAALEAQGWEAKPCGRRRLKGLPDDPEDNVLKEFLIAGALLERRAAIDNGAAREAEEKGLLQLAYPILIGRQEPKGHPNYPRMGNFFHVQGGGGRFPDKVSLPTNLAVGQFLQDKAGLPAAAVASTVKWTVAACVRRLMALQGCQMWSHSPDLPSADLTKEQKALSGAGYAGPPVVLEGIDLTEEQKQLCRNGLDEAQLRMLKAEIRDKRQAFHEVIDRAVDCIACAGESAAPEHSIQVRRSSASALTPAHMARRQSLNEGVRGPLATIVSNTSGGTSAGALPWVESHIGHLLARNLAAQLPSDS